MGTGEMVFWSNKKDVEISSIRQAEREALKAIEEHKRNVNEPIALPVANLVGAILVADAINNLAAALRERGGGQTASGDDAPGEDG